MNKPKAYLGIDCGSVSVKLALIDESEKVIDTVYLKNNGILETLSKGLEKIKTEDYEIKGVGTTGSGRIFAGTLVGADQVKTEILAHTIATLKYHPNARTIMDIGGEDCKIMVIRDGVLEDFKMNSVCGAGTGSIIDSIANRLGVTIEEVGDLALTSTNKVDFPGKCGVFTQSAVVSKLNAGLAKNDILMGITNALVNNYLMLGKGISLRPPFIYQGATSKNKAIVHALETHLGEKIIVPEYASVMGAIGIALMTKQSEKDQTNFRGFDLKERNLTTRNLTAKGCENQCDITYFLEKSKVIGYIGNRCAKCVGKE